MVFKEFKTEDKEKIEKYTVRDGENTCEFTFYNLLMWQRLYGMCYAEEDNTLIIRVGEKGNYIYALPFGDFETGMEKLRRITGEEYPAVWGQDGDRFEKFKSLYGEHYEITELRDEFDYVYERKALASLSGKKYHSKRNHISAFSSSHEWGFKKITPENFEEIKECSRKWYAENADKSDADMEEEQKALSYIFSHGFLNGISGGAVRTDGKTVAFTFGMPVNRETFDILIEKALHDYSEAYAVINREFAASLPENFKYINREDDLGIEGLRKAKLSYHPAFFVKKYLCRKRDTEAIKRIYTEAFGESGEFDSAFFKEFSKYAVTEQKNGKTVSVLFKIPCIINKEKIYYIYAAATDKSYRNQGFMKKLLERTASTSDAPLFLVPSEASLVKFYEKCGFYKKKGVNKNGDIKINVQKKQEQLSLLCDNCPESFDIMFSFDAEDKLYEFPFAMQ